MVLAPKPVLYMCGPASWDNVVGKWHVVASKPALASDVEAGAGDNGDRRELYLGTEFFFCERLGGLAVIRDILLFGLA